MKIFVYVCYLVINQGKYEFVKISTFARSKNYFFLLINARFMIFIG